MVETFVKIRIKPIFTRDGWLEFKVEMSASVGGFSLHFCGQCHLFFDDQNVQKNNCIVRLCLHSKLDGRP
jgi:hypothetical protein